MPKLNENRVPNYRLHKQSGQGIVTLSGKDYLLGPYKSKASKTKYDRLLAEWIAAGRQPLHEPRSANDGTVPTQFTVLNLCAAYWRHAKGYYRNPDGTPGGELANIARALHPLKNLYGDTPAAQFGPLALRAVRDEMIRRGWARTSINRQVGRVRHAFRWAVSHQLLPAHIVQALETVEGLRYGKSQARESDPVKPVPEAHWRAILPYCSRQVAALVELQAITGMRPTEALTMRGCDIDTSADLWLYRPPKHKNLHRGHERIIYLGPRAQEIIQQFMTLDRERYLFRPCDAEADRRGNPRKSRAKRNPKKLCAPAGPTQAMHLIIGALVPRVLVH